eukprot:2933-Heterococcus_DN1.PRE.1
MVRVSLALRLALAASCWVMAAGFLRSFWLTKPSDASAKSPQIDALDTALRNYYLDTIPQDHHDRPPAGYNIELMQAIATGVLDAVQDMMLAQSSVATDFVSFLAPCTMGVTANDVDLMMLMTKMVDVIEHPGTLFATVAAACDSLDVPADATEELLLKYKALDICTLIHCNMMIPPTVLSIVADPDAFNEVLVVLAEHLRAARQAANESTTLEPFLTETDRAAYVSVNRTPEVEIRYEQWSAKKVACEFKAEATMRATYPAITQMFKRAAAAQAAGDVTKCSRLAAALLHNAVKESLGGLFTC